MKTKLKGNPYKTKKREQYSNLPEFIHIQNLKRIRKELNISQSEFAPKLETKHQTFVCWELGYNIPRFDKFLQWCQLLGYNPFQ